MTDEAQAIKDWIGKVKTGLVDQNEALRGENGRLRVAMQCAASMIERGYTAEAIKRLRDALKVNPLEPDPLVETNQRLGNRIRQARFHIKRGQPKLALQALDDASLKGGD